MQGIVNGCRFEKQKEIKMSDYASFLSEKEKQKIDSGFHVELSELNSNLKDFQKYVVQKSLKAGKYAIFANTGLGKTIMQLEIARNVVKKTGEPALILTTLGVTNQTILEGEKFGIKVEKYQDGEILSDGIYISNYDQLKNIDTNLFSCIALDESSILKNESGKFRNELIEKFKTTPYKYAFSATPSPNDPMELGNHSEFLDVMGYNEMLAMYFTHDGGQTSKWRLKGHAESIFWSFVSTWGIMFSHPKDIGFNDEGYDLPELEINEIQVQTEVPDGMLFGGLAVSATEYNKSLRDTENERITETLKIIQGLPDGEPVIVWTKQNEEAKNIYKKLSELGYLCRNVQGSDKPEKKESDLIGFAKGEFQILITKGKIASQGLNYQHCGVQIFNSVDFSFEGTYQSIRRSWRFGRKDKVQVFMITTDRMINVVKTQNEKQKQFSDMQEKMKNAIIDNAKNNEAIKQNDIITDKYKCLHGDCVQRIKEVSDNEVDLIVFSPPFAELYTYSSHNEDMGNSSDYKQFEKHFKFLIPELKRVLKSGRICAIHCMDLPIQKGKEGFIGLRNFSDMLVEWFTNEGFIYHARTTVWKDPVIEMQRTKAIGLLYKQLKKDAVLSRVGIPDQILFFRNEGDNTVPVMHSDTYGQPNYLPVDLWQKYASPVWYDINYSRTLNYRAGRANEDEKHICPLQLDTIERVVHLYTNEGETVLSPFGGIGSEGFQSLKMGRKSISIELKESYFKLNKRNHNDALEQKKQLSMF